MDSILNLDGTVYLAASEPIPAGDVVDVTDGESILEVLNSILDYDVATWNLLAYGINRVRFIERDVASILEVISPSEQETALKESTKETTQAVNDSLFADDAPTKVTVDDVTDIAQIGSAASSMFDSGVSIGSFFDVFNDIGFIAFFSQETYDDLNTVQTPVTYSCDDESGYVDYYSENIDKIQQFVGGDGA